MKRRHDSTLRDAFVGVLMTVGPFFGVRYQPPRVEIPVVTTPATDDEDPAAYEREPEAARDRVDGGDDCAGDGVTL
ncbi:MAG: hypothetical protein ACHQ06_03500 [Candidatus Dormibacteria bacterium]|jgi:hypothetical protein